MMFPGQTARFILLSGFVCLFLGIELLAAQIIDPQKIRTLPGPVSDQVCTLSNTHVDAHYSVQLQDLIGDLSPQQMDTRLEVTYFNACGGNEWPEEAIQAFEYAADIWSMHLDSSVPVRIEARWENIGALGQAGPSLIIHSSAIPTGEDNSWYAVAQANAMTGIDFLETSGEDFDMVVSVNCTLQNWYFGLDAEPGSGDIDFVTVVLHEIGHGIGFFGTFLASNIRMEAEWGIPFQEEETPMIYDRFAEDGEGISLLEENIYPNPSNDLYQAVTGMRGGVLFVGPESTRMLAGEGVYLYSPTSWQGGASFSHLDEDTFRQTENALMIPRFDQAFAMHTPGPVFCGMLDDWGWPLGSGCRMILDVDVFVQISEETLDFDLVNIGRFSDRTFFISNEETVSDTLIGSVQVEGESFQIQSGDGSFSIEPGEVLEVTVRFQPHRVGVQEGVIQVYHNAFNESSPFEVNLSGEGLEEDVLARLDQNFPNPFHAGSEPTQINYGLPQNSRVRMDLFDSLGRHIKTMVDEQQTAGRYEYIMESHNLASGVYIYRIVVDQFMESRKMTLIR